MTQGGPSQISVDQPTCKTELQSTSATTHFLGALLRKLAYSFIEYKEAMRIAVEFPEGHSVDLHRWSGEIVYWIRVVQIPGLGEEESGSS